ncbi:tetratricopeptide repeat protein [Polaribacter uvawellassae]|uniref:tetratricopeptide repeat protein n=1 Tax=Polaribacter uvawellassae TaxID=3133495 RepID=UPI00321A1951
MKDKEFDKNLQKAITASERKKQKRFLKSVEASLNDVDVKPKKVSWLVAAAIVVLIGLSSYFTLFNTSLSSDELYNNYYTPYKNVVEPIVRNQTELSKKAQVFADYELGNYQNAIVGFNQLKKQDSVAINTINFFKANAYLQLKEYQKAQTLFNQIIETDTKEWKQESNWYLALIALKLKDKNSAKEYLQNLQKQTFKNKELKDLLDKLK